MLLSVDAGNTNTVFAIFDGASLCATFRCATHSARTADEYASFLRPLMRGAEIKHEAITDAIIGSVVPEANFHLKCLCRDHFHCTALFVGAPDVKIGIKVLLDNPKEIGADRIINAVGGLLAHKPPLLIVDFGTATTFDVVDSEGSYVGGAIAPGINLSLRALHMAAAKLPTVDIAPSKTVIGRNTVDAIQSGLYWGYASLIEGMIGRIKTEFGKPMTVIATGGLAGLFRHSVSSLQFVERDLTLQGLREIFERNRVSP